MRQARRPLFPDGNSAGRQIGQLTQIDPAFAGGVKVAAPRGKELELAGHVGVALDFIGEMAAAGDFHTRAAMLLKLGEQRKLQRRGEVVTRRMRQHRHAARCPNPPQRLTQPGPAMGHESGAAFLEEALKNLVHRSAVPTLDQKPGEVRAGHQLRVGRVRQRAFVSARDAGSRQAFAHLAGPTIAPSSDAGQPFHQRRVIGIHVQPQHMHGFAGKTHRNFDARDVHHPQCFGFGAGFVLASQLIVIRERPDLHAALMRTASQLAGGEAAIRMGRMAVKVNVEEMHAAHSRKPRQPLRTLRLSWPPLLLAPRLPMSPDASVLALPAVSAEDLRAALAACGPVAPRWVECAFGDFSAVARGKRVHPADFVGMKGCRAPSVVLGLTLTSGEPDTVFGPLLPATYDDMHLVPDLSTLAPRPGRSGEVTVICEPSGPLPTAQGPIDAARFSPRAALRRVVAQLAAQGLQATVAPELELFFLERDATGRPQAARPHTHAPVRERCCDVLSLERLSHFEPYFDELYAACDTLGIPVNGHAHESALAQYEVNFRPGPPVTQADAVWRFKRLAREIAARHGFLASFAPKPFLDEPGTGMHWHISLQRTDAGAGEWPHVFAQPSGEDSPALGHFVAGIQRHAAAAMAFFAPSDMAWERIALSNASPTHATWGQEGRDLALRIPASGPTSRRVENRLPGGDANPYLLLAATLGAGAWGLRTAPAPIAGRDEALALPRSLPEALATLADDGLLRDVLGAPLVDLFCAVKHHEHAQRAALADPRTDWDLTHLLELA